MADRRLKALLGHLRPDDGSPVPAAVSASTYRYTVSGRAVLSEKQRAAYERDGFHVVPGLVSRADLQTYTERFRDLCCGADKTPGLTIMKDVSIAKSEFGKKERAITKIQNFQVGLTDSISLPWPASRAPPPQNDPLLSRYFCLPAILRYVECFIGPDIMAMHTMLINKPPDPGMLSSRHPMHQGTLQPSSHPLIVLTFFQTFTISLSDLRITLSVRGLQWNMFTVVMGVWWCCLGHIREACNLTSTLNGRFVLSSSLSWLTCEPPSRVV